MKNRAKTIEIHSYEDTWAGQEKPKLPQAGGAAFSAPEIVPGTRSIVDAWCKDTTP